MPWVTDNLLRFRSPPLRTENCSRRRRLWAERFNPWPMEIHVSALLFGLAGEEAGMRDASETGAYREEMPTPTADRMTPVSSEHFSPLFFPVNIVV